MAASERIPRWKWRSDRFGHLQAGDPNGSWWVRADFNNSQIQVVARVRSDFWVDPEKLRIDEWLPGHNEYPSKAAVARTKELYRRGRAWVQERLDDRARWAEPGAAAPDDAKGGE